MNLSPEAVFKYQYHDRPQGRYNYASSKHIFRSQIWIKPHAIESAFCGASFKTTGNSFVTESSRNNSNNSEKTTVNKPIMQYINCVS